MNREFLINIIFLLFVNLLIKPFYIFGIERVIQNRVIEGDYGLYFNLFSFALIFQIINDLGIQFYNNRNIAQHGHLLAKYFPGMLLLKGLLGLVYFIVLVVVAQLWGYEVEIYKLLLPIGLNQLLTSLILFLRSNVSGLAMYRTDSFISVLDRLLLIAICGTLLLMMPIFKIEWFVYAQTTSLSITALIAFFTFRSRLGKIQLRFRPALLLLILKKSYPYALAVFLMATYTRLDGVMIERLLPNGRIEADIYASAYRLLEAASMLGFLFAGLLLPMFARILKERQAIEPLLRFSLQIIWAGAVTIAVTLFFFQEQIMVALYDTGGAYSGQILGILIIGFIAIACTYIYGPLLTANGSLRQMNYIFITGVVLNITLNLILIPKYGALGAAIVTSVTQFFVAIAEVWLAHSILKLRMNLQISARLVSFLILSIATTFLASQYLDINWFIKFISSFFLCIILAFALRLIHLRDAFQILQAKRPE